MKKAIFFIFIIASIQSFSQTVTPEGIFASADYFGNEFAKISWTIGDAQTSTLKSEDKDNIITQGFLQPNFVVVGINETSNSKYDNLNIDVFPNPVKDILNIRFSGMDTEVYYELCNMEGKIINSGINNASLKLMELRFTSFQNGYYILRINSKDKMFMKTYKILFQN